jgi:putative transposase
MISARRLRLTTDCNHRFPTTANVIARNFNSSAPPQQSRTGDVTHIDTSEGWLYLSVMIDLFSR